MIRKPTKPNPRHRVPLLLIELSLRDHEGYQEGSGGIWNASVQTRGSDTGQTRVKHGPVIRLNHSRPYRVQLAKVRVNVINCLLNRRNFLGFFIRNFALELFLKGHYQLYGVKRVRT